MPCSDQDYYSFKYVNGHPQNPRAGKLSVVALGVLARVDDGYPVLLSEMTLLTAFRTAATAAVAARYLARPESTRLAMIGCGAQSEFQILALSSLFPIQSLSLYDIDKQAMAKCAQNLRGEVPQIQPCETVQAAVAEADIIVTATAAKKRQSLFGLADIKPGTHIQAIGGDCPGKTEFDSAFLSTLKVVVEYRPQSLREGELQQLADVEPYAELWELVQGRINGRETAEEVTLFDSVGFALADFSVLMLIYELLAEDAQLQESDLIPAMENPKDLFGLLLK
jgi:ornithine cyclodeaminase